MKAQLLRFVNLLRGAGLRITPEEVLDCALGMEHIGLSSKSRFRSLLESTLVKRAEDLETFGQLFDLFFAGMELPAETLSSPLPDLEEASSVTELLAQMDGALSPWLREMILNGLTAFPAALPEAAARAGLENIRFPMQIPQIVQKIRRQFGMEGWAQEMERLLSTLAAREVSAETRTSLEQGLLDRLGVLEEMIRAYTERNARAYLEGNKPREPPAELWDKGFGALSAWEIRSMQHAVQDLARKIRDEASLRQRRAKKGRFDLKHTLRRNLRYGGMPLEVAFRKRRKSKSRIVVLCDVSSSVWNASRFMLHLLYSLQDQFDKVRSFVFVDQLGEITGFFERLEVNEAVETALGNAGIPYNRYTDYGSVFKQFQEEHLDAVNRKTTFIVIGDGRNNFFHPGDDCLARIRSRSRRVIWLNPESRGFWKFGDSMMHRYGKHCDEVRECRNLKQLMDFVNRLTL